MSEISVQYPDHITDAPITGARSWHQTASCKVAHILDTEICTVDNV